MLLRRGEEAGEFHSRKPAVEPVMMAAAASGLARVPSDGPARRRARGSKVEGVLFGVFATGWSLGDTDGRREVPGDCSVIHWSLSNSGRAWGGR